MQTAQANLWETKDMDLLPQHKNIMKRLTINSIRRLGVIINMSNVARMALECTSQVQASIGTVLITPPIMVNMQVAPNSGVMRLLTKNIANSNASAKLKYNSTTRLKADMTRISDIMKERKTIPIRLKVVISATKVTMYHSRLQTSSLLPTTLKSMTIMISMIIRKELCHTPHIRSSINHWARTTLRFMSKA